MTDGRWTVDRQEAQVDPILIPPLPFEGARVQRERITKQAINEFGALLDAQAAMQSGTTKEHKHNQTVEECQLRRDSEPVRMGQRDWTGEMK